MWLTCLLCVRTAALHVEWFENKENMVLFLFSWVISLTWHAYFCQESIHIQAAIQAYPSDDCLDKSASFNWFQVLCLIRLFYVSLKNQVKNFQGYKSKTCFKWKRTIWHFTSYFPSRSVILAGPGNAQGLLLIKAPSQTKSQNCSGCFRLTHKSSPFEIKADDIYICNSHWFFYISPCSTASLLLWWNKLWNLLRKNMSQSTNVRVILFY